MIIKMGDYADNKQKDWDNYFLDIAKSVSTRATCPRLSVGSVIVSKDRNILATGYNGSVRGMDHCKDIGCCIVENHCVRTVHAEENAILQAAKNGHSVKDAIIYVTHSPCLNCFKHILNAGIERIVWAETYKIHPEEHLKLLNFHQVAYSTDNEINIYKPRW